MDPETDKPALSAMPRDALSRAALFSRLAKSLTGLTCSGGA